MAALEIVNTPLYTDANLVEYWQFEGNANGKNGNNGTGTGAVYSTSYGQFNQGVSCAGASQNNIAFGAKIVPAGAKTISFWYQKIGTTTNSQSIIDTSQQNAANNGTYIITSTDGGTITWVEGPNLFTINVTAPDTNKNLYTFTWDGTTSSNQAIIYINGVSNSTQTSTSSTQSAGYRNLNIAGLTGYSYPLKGYLDDLAIFSRALIPSEVLSLYTGDWSKGFPKFYNFI